MPSFALVRYEKNWMGTRKPIGITAYPHDDQGEEEATREYERLNKEHGEFSHEVLDSWCTAGSDIAGKEIVT